MSAAQPQAALPSSGLLGAVACPSTSQCTATDSAGASGSVTFFWVISCC